MLSKALCPNWKSDVAMSPKVVVLRRAKDDVDRMISLSNLEWNE